MLALPALLSMIWHSTPSAILTITATAARLMLPTPWQERSRQTMSFYHNLRQPQFFAIALILLCSSSMRAQDPSKITLPQPQSPTNTAFQSGGSGSIGPGDLLEITIFDTPELSGKARVSNSGDISLPLLGQLHLNGLTTDQAQKLIAQSLIDRQLIKDPQVSVFVAEYATQ